MTSPLRKKHRTIASKTRTRTSQAKLAVRCSVCLLIVGGITFGGPQAKAQTQAPPKFQQPNSYRYLLGVRNESSSGYGAAQAAGQQRQVRYPVSTQSNGIYPGSSNSDQPIGSGVRNRPQHRSVQYGSSQYGSAQHQTTQYRNPQRQAVEPINDPFGDRDTPSYTRRESGQYGSVRPAVARGSSQRLIRPVSRNTPVTGTQQQESILRRPENAQNASDRNDIPSTPGNFSLDPMPRSGFQVQESGKAGNEIPRPNQNIPMTNPMSRPRIQEDPMARVPRRNPNQDLRQQRYELDCEEINGVMLQKSIRQITLNMEPQVEDGKVKPQDCEFGGGPVYARCWAPQTFNFTASAACSKPLLFQHIQLERYGHSRGPVVQPVLSAAHFFGNAVIMPYKSFFHPANECMYALGYYRPGDCAPWLREPWPWPSFDRAWNPALGTRTRGRF